MAELIDNSAKGTINQVLRQAIQPHAQLSLMSIDFSVYAFLHLHEALHEVESVRLLIPYGDAAPLDQDGAWLDSSRLVGDGLERPERNRLILAYAARSCAEWLRAKADIRLALTPTTQNMIHVSNPDGNNVAIHGTSPFTTAGLGLLPASGFDINTCFSTAHETDSLLHWFNSIWTSSTISHDFKDMLIGQLDEFAKPRPAQMVYGLTLHNLFHDTQDDLTENQVIKTRTGVQDTRIWRQLYRFQRDGVLGAIDKIEKYNGCVIADSVGLGKTYEALAIIKYYELRNDRVLVLCPKKLRENWTVYTINDRRNLFAGDRFNFDVLNHTDLTRERGYSGEINLETINWGNYDLVVIDESHNFRNNPPRKSGQTRYSRLMRDIIRSGVKTKVLMLSATPVNNRLNDLKNQVAFITEGQDHALADWGIESIEATLRRAQSRFNAWLKEDPTSRSKDDLLDSLNFGYFKVLDMLTIARSRKHIAKYYDLSEVGPFPHRAKPVNITSDIDADHRFPELREINRDIRRLNLSAYAPLKYVRPDKIDEYSRKYDMIVSGGSVFKQIDREESLIHLMRVNLLKRMESSIHAFRLTVHNLLNNVRNLIQRIEDHDDADIDELSIEDIELEDESLEPYLIGNKIKVLIQDMDRIRWKQELEEDEELLLELLDEAQQIDASRDAKLHQLQQTIARKCRNPINSQNRKVLIFTAFADTANYLYEHISEWAESELELHSAVVSGRSGANRTTMPEVSTDIASILTSFSPRAKQRTEIDPNMTEEIDILISTDCLSEGQNLQDCDYLINYDIHWNPVRIIQRFGRIDRLGSENDTIQLVNFWPNMELDEYINLEARVSGRMVLLDISATGEENVIEYTDADEMNDLEYRRRQLEQLQEEVVDLEDLSDGISITDMTLNDFRMDLADLHQNSAKPLMQMPPGLFAVTTADEELKPGAVFCLRSENDQVEIDPHYPLAPYYLVYVSDEGEIRLSIHQTKQILDQLRRLAQGRASPDDTAYARFNERTQHGADMRHYQWLLSQAVFALTGKAEEKGIESLFQRGGTIVSRDTFRGIDDFEVMAYLVIVP